jgi:hypothetical protein
MKTRQRNNPLARWRGAAVILALALLLAASATLRHPTPAVAQQGSPAADSSYNLTWWTVDGGGGRSVTTGQVYNLEGTLGQPDAGSLTSASYTLTGGFWSGHSTFYRTNLPLTLKTP